MRNWRGLAVLLGAALGGAGVCWQFAAAQATDPAAPPAGLTGTGPRVDVQTGANGTLDVGGPRGADVDMTGGNFRGSFGASRPQSGSGPSPGVPAPNLPGFGRRPLGPPSFGPNLPGNSPLVDRDTLRAADGKAGISDLILPRFRRGLGGSDGQSGTRQPEPDGWRYQFFRGRWWYWQPSQSWVYWDGWQWKSYASRL